MFGNSQFLGGTPLKPLKKLAIAAVAVTGLVGLGGCSGSAKEADLEKFYAGVQEQKKGRIKPLPPFETVSPLPIRRATCAARLNHLLRCRLRASPVAARR